MTDVPPTDAPDPAVPEDQALAAEWALGLLEEPERAAARARLARDPVFAAQARAWQEMLAGMADDLTPVMVPQRAKRALDQRLGLAAPAALDLVAPVRRGWRRRTAGLTTAAAALAVIVMVALPTLRPAPEPGARDYAATMAQGSMRLEARMIGSDRVMEVRMTGATAPAGRDYELWWIAPGTAPVSLGVIPRGGQPGRMPLPAGLEPVDGVVLAVTDEPLGGAPGGVPSGAPMISGPLTIL